MGIINGIGIAIETTTQDGVPSGGPPFEYTAIANNYSMTFDGTNYIDINNEYDATNGITMSCWIKYDGVGAGLNWLCSNGSTSGTKSQFNTRMAADGRWFNYFQGGAVYTGISGLADGNWHHIVQTVDYITGRVFYYKDSQRSPALGVWGSTYSTAIISSISTSFYPFLGSVDEFAIFESVLSEETIEKIYNTTNNNPGKVADLSETPEGAPTAWYRFE